MPCHDVTFTARKHENLHKCMSITKPAYIQKRKRLLVSSFCYFVYILILTNVQYPVRCFIFVHSYQSKIFASTPVPHESRWVIVTFITTVRRHTLFTRIALAERCSLHAEKKNLFIFCYFVFSNRAFENVDIYDWAVGVRFGLVWFSLDSFLEGNKKITL